MHAHFSQHSLHHYARIIYWFFLVCQTVLHVSVVLPNVAELLDIYLQCRTAQRNRQLFPQLAPYFPLPSHCISSLRTHESPVSHSEEARKRVEWDVASWALWVVVWRAQLCASGVEAATAEGRWEAGGSGSGEHLERSACFWWARRVSRTLKSCSGMGWRW